MTDTPPSNDIRRMCKKKTPDEGPETFVAIDAGPMQTHGRGLRFSAEEVEQMDEAEIRSEIARLEAEIKRRRAIE